GAPIFTSADSRLPNFRRFRFCNLCKSAKSVDDFHMSARIFFLTLFAMIAFASNSLLCRAALKETGIDAASFTLIRILSGALALWLIITMRKRTSSVAAVYDRRTHGNWVSGLALFAYAATF